MIDDWEQAYEKALTGNNASNIFRRIVDKHLHRKSKHSKGIFLQLKDLSQEEGTLDFTTGNGQNWLRFLNKYLDITKHKDKRGKIISFRVDGKASWMYNNRNSQIPQWVKKLLRGKTCVMCGSGSQCQDDHKNGDKHPIIYFFSYMFQKLCRHCNMVKNSRCKKCQKTGKRFDARDIGYNYGWLIGNEKYDSAELGCVGCYQYDPKQFRSMLYFTDSEINRKKIIFDNIDKIQKNEDKYNIQQKENNDNIALPTPQVVQEVMNLEVLSA
jgi:hypothetical protein